MDASTSPRESRPSRPAFANPYADDAREALAGVAHQDAEPNAKRAARRYSTALRTQYHHREAGSPEMRAAQLWLSRSAWATRHGARLMAEAQRAELDGLTEAQVIDRYHEALAHEAEAEGQDRALDVSRSAGWLDRTAATERDMAWDARKAACERWFAEHGTPAERVR